MTDGLNLPLVDVAGVTREFASAEAFIDFARAESKYWSDVSTRLDGNPAKQRSQYLSSAISVAQTFIQAADCVQSWLPVPDGLDKGNYFQSKRPELLKLLGQLANRWVASYQPFVERWLECYGRSPRVGDSFFDVIIKNKVDLVKGDVDVLVGANLAYEFMLQDDSDLQKRRLAEAQTIDMIRKQLIDSKDALLGEVSGFKKECHTWLEDVQDQVGKWRDEGQGTWDSLLQKYSDEFLESMRSWDSKITGLEDTYREKLRFSGPAAYWKKQAHKFRCQGIIWVMALLASVALSVVFFRELFLAWADGQRLPLSLTTLEGAVIFAAILSAFIFLARVFSRLAFSSFHLQRDAEEREQLTHLYLALGHEGQFDSASRQVVLQALFSRSETGLLAAESGPTMPGLQEAISAASKKASS